MPIASGDKFLHQGNIVQAHFDVIGIGGGLQIFGGIVAHDARATAADIRFHHHGKPHPARRLRGIRATMDYPRPGRGQTELGEHGKLQRFGNLVGECRAAVNNPRAQPLKVREKIERVPDRAASPAQISRRTHAVEEHVKRPVRLRRVIPKRLAGIQPDIRDAAPVEFRKKRPEPVRVFMVDGECRLRRVHAGK